jgi:hypothetical protein
LAAKTDAGLTYNAGTGALTATSFTDGTSVISGGTIELGHAIDTTIARSVAGAVTIEGLTVILSGDTFTGDVTATLDTDGSTALTIADSVAVSSWTLTTPIITSGAIFTGADASPDANGELVYDTIVTGLDDGAFAYYGGGDTIYYIIASDVLPVTNDHVLAYNSATDRTYWKADADSGGAPAWNAVTNPAADQTLTGNDL